MYFIIVQELCDSWGGCPGLSVLTSLLVSVDVKLYWTVLRHWFSLSLICQLTSEDIKQHFIIIMHFMGWATMKEKLYWGLLQRRFLNMTVPQSNNLEASDVKLASTVSLLIPLSLSNSKSVPLSYIYIIVCHPELRGSVDYVTIRYLSPKMSKTNNSRLDYCNSLLAGYTKYLLSKLQTTTAAKMY